MTVNQIEKKTTLSERMIRNIGTPTSILLHTIFFIGMFGLVLFGVRFEKMLIGLTTILSIEAIYLALFIQMTVNKTSEDIEDVEKDIDAIQEDERKDDIFDAELSKSLKIIEQRLGVLQDQIIKKHSIK